MLIAEGRAKILNNFQFSISNLQSNSNDPILQLIQDQGLDVSEIARRLGKSASEIGSELTMLMLKGDVEEREGKYFVLK